MVCAEVGKGTNNSGYTRDPVAQGSRQGYWRREGRFDLTKVSMKRSWRESVFSGKRASS